MLKAYGGTNKGLVRATNQDSYTLQKLGCEALLAVVCDGMGGATGGNIASRNAVNIISQHISSNYRDDYDDNHVRNMLLSAVAAANALVYDMAQKDEKLTGMGTTVVACVVKGGCAHILHAGDSRAYRLENGVIARVTRDHSLVQLLVENGELTEEEARVHPKKHFITRALGVSRELDPDYSEYALAQPGEQLLLCTDGLTNHLTERELQEILAATLPEDIPQVMINRANERGGSDNITAVVLCEE